MLYISRRIGESILIDGKIEVVLHQIAGKQVKLGILAPKNTSVYRKELLEKILNENKMAYEAAMGLFESNNNSNNSENPMSEIRNKLSTLNSLLHKAIAEVKRGDTVNVNSIFKIMTDLEPIIENNSDHLIQEIVSDLIEKYDELIVELKNKQKDLEDELTKIRNNMRASKVYK